MTPGVAAKLAFTSHSLSLTAGNRGQISVMFEDQYGNLGAAAAGTQSIDLATTSASGAFLRNAHQQHADPKYACHHRSNSRHRSTMPIQRPARSP